eukprot:Rhum_TRINITY_DN21338_c0_g3::Rhum_TRINITY_DN21338_c0_g3_i1::g.173824::m.173824
MLVHVEVAGCETLVLPVPLDGLIGDVRRGVAEALDVKPCLLTVHWDGSPVDDDTGVGELGVCDGDVLQCAKVRIPSGVVASVEKPAGVRVVLFTACEEYFLLVFERAWERRGLDGTVVASATLEQPVCQAVVAGANLLLSHPDNTVAVHCCADARVVCVLDTFLPPSFYVGSGGRADPYFDASALSLRLASHDDGRFASCVLQGDSQGAVCVFDLQGGEASPQVPPRAEPSFRRGAAQDGGAAYGALAVGRRGSGEHLLALGTEKLGCPEVVLLGLDTHDGDGNCGGGKAASSDPLLRLAGNRAAILNATFSNGAKTVFGASEHDIAVWETSEGAMLMRMRCSQAMQWYTLAVSASNEQLFSENDFFCSVFKLNENSCIYAGQVSSTCRDESAALCVSARQLYRVRELGERQGKRVELHTYNAVSTDPFEHFCDLADYPPSSFVQCLPSPTGHKCLVLLADRIDVLQ